MAKTVTLTEEEGRTVAFALQMLINAKAEASPARPYVAMQAVLDKVKRELWGG